jgi:hypothetical protein
MYLSSQVLTAESQSITVLYVVALLVRWKFIDVSEALFAIFLMMEAASTTETSVKFYQTTRWNNLDDSHL